MGHPARQSRGPAFLWLAVGYMLTDTVASLKLLSPVDLPPESMPQGGDGDSGSGGGGSGGDTRAVLVDKLIRFWFSSKLQRGELVLMRSPEEPRRKVVRRLVALENDWISPAGGRVERVPQGSCWVEADSGLRAVGGDSRVSWGPVPLALVEGRVSRVLWPPAGWGHPPPQAQPPSGTRLVGRDGKVEFLEPPKGDKGDMWS